MGAASNKGEGKTIELPPGVDPDAVVFGTAKDYPPPDIAPDGYGTIDQRCLMVALAKVQAAIAPAVKRSANKHFDTSYADLKEIVEACRPALAEHKIARTQMLRFTGDELWVETRLYHGPSGQWVKMNYPIQTSAKANSQQLVGAITYAKRASLAMAVGVVSEDEDDDGEGERIMAGDRGEDTAEQRPQETTAFIKAQQWCSAAIRAINNLPNSERLVQWEEANTDNLVKVRKLAPDEHKKVLEAMQQADTRFGAGKDG